MVTLYLTTGKGWISALIRFFTWSKWSHVLVQDGEDAIEARGLIGVRRLPLAEALAGASRVEKVSVSVKDEVAFFNALRAEVGKPYDYMAVIGILFRRNWQSPRAWDCAELTAYAFDKAGDPLFRQENLSRVTPAHFGIIAPGRLVI